MTNDLVEKLPTGITGFDEIAQGGLPAERSTLVAGTTGCGKTLFAMQFLARGIELFDQTAVFVTFEETPADIRKSASSLGIPIQRWEDEGKWAFVDVSSEVSDATSTVGTYTLTPVVARIEAAVRSVGAARVALDSIGAVFARYPDVRTVRDEVLRFIKGVNSLAVTSVHTSERLADYNGISRLGVEEFVFSNVVLMRNVLDAERRRRTIEVVKFRAAPHRTGEWLFTIDAREGIVVIPLVLVAPSERASQTRVSSGIPKLDEMCGGGFYKDATILLTGPTGSGKTLTSLTFTDAAYRAGEHCILYTFDETRDQLARNAAGWGYDLAAMQASGLVQIRAEPPELASLEDHFLAIRRSVEQERPIRVVIDTLSSLERIATPRALLDFVIALGSLLREHEITTLLTSAPPSPTARTFTPAAALEVGSLADVSIMLRYVETGGEIQLAIAVLQTRGSAHDRHIRQVTIDSEGMHIGDQLNVRSDHIPAGTFLPVSQR
ncbi:circadian clock protein KaiC [Actinopolymorpha sp. B17G11]|uniref:circadian clock protein KaiC n=1 Tax=Actinopolymorpha sp. B17G11 TaxID=3160861 RepID=UPI0032E3B25E